MSNGIFDLDYDPLRKIEKEVKDLKRIINESPEPEKYVRVSEGILEIIKTHQEIINGLIKSNLELQSKIVEATISMNNLSRELKKLLDILVSAARDAKKEKKSPIDLSPLVSILKSVQETNEKMLKNLEELSKKMDDLIEKLSAKEKNRESKLPLPPRLLPPPPPKSFIGNKR